MTNKQERFLVMSEAEFEAALRTRVRAVTYVCNYDGDIYEELQEEMTQAEAACRARPVPEWATHFVEFPVAPHGVGYRISVQKHEEIKK